MGLYRTMGELYRDEEARATNFSSYVKTLLKKDWENLPTDEYEILGTYWNVPYVDIPFTNDGKSEIFYIKRYIEDNLKAGRETAVNLFLTKAEEWTGVPLLKYLKQDKSRTSGASAPAKDQAPPTKPADSTKNGDDKDSSKKDDDSGGGGGGGSGTEKTKEEKAKEEEARKKAEEEAKEKAAAESAKKAEENLDIAKKLKSAPDSDQCKISRLYTPLTQFYFKNREESAAGTSLFMNNAILFCEKQNELAQDQNLTKNSSSDMDLFYLENHQYSAYTPSVELYKVIRTKGSTGTISGIQDIIHIAFPTSGKNTENLQMRGMQDEQLEMDNIGIKSVSWHFDGTDRFTADKYVSAEIVLVTENFDSLFVERTSLGQGVLGTATVQPRDSRTYKIADLLFRPGCLDQPSAPAVATSPPASTSYSSDLTNEYTPECFEILLVAGNSTSSRLAPSSKKMKASMFLTLLDHQFDFKENGSVEVRIRYRGRLEAVLRSPAADVTINRTGLFASDELIKQVAEIAKVQYLEEKYVKLFKEFSPDATGNSTQERKPMNYNTLASKVEELIKKFQPTDSTKKENSAVREVKAKLQQIETLIDKELKLQFFAQVSKILIDKKKVYNLSIDPLVTVMQDYLDNPSTEKWTALNDYYLKEFNDTQGQTIVTSLESVPERTPAQPSTTTAGTSNAPGGMGGGALPASEAAASPVAEEDEAEDQEESSSPKDIPFVFFGDLLDSIISVCNNLEANGGKNNIFKDIKIVLSNVKLPSYAHNLNGRLQIYPIAGLPVAYKTLNSFANNKTSIGKKSYSFLSLIRDMINFILPECLGTQCSQNQFMPSVRSNLYSFTSFGKVNGGFDASMLTEQNALSTGTTTGGVSLKTILPSFKDEYDHGTSSKDITEMLLVYVENTDYSANTVGFNLNSDKNKGIPWYIFGYDRGIFKKAQLTKMDQPFVLEARFRENKGSYLNQFSNMYKATIEMVGNNLLNVGGYIWLDFSGISANLGNPKSSNSISYYMGLGGLYLIIDIKSNMVPGNFTTTVEARFVSRGFGGGPAPVSAGASAVIVVPQPTSALSNRAYATAATIPVATATSLATNSARDEMNFTDFSMDSVLERDTLS